MKIKRGILISFIIIIIIVITIEDRFSFIYNITSNILTIDESASKIVKDFYNNPNDEMTYKDIVYKERDGLELKLDIYQSEKDQNSKSPVLIYVFGNAWMYGNKSLPESISPLINALQEEGFTVISTSYELLRDEPIFDKQVSDVKDTIRWIYKNEDKYKLDTDNIGILSLSAGSHLSMLASFSDTDEFVDDVTLSEYPSDISYIINLFGPAILDNINLSLASNEVFDKLNDFNIRELSYKYSPINYIKEDLPNMLIVHSTADTIVPFSDSLELYYEGLKFNNDFKFLKLEGSSHYLDNLSEVELIKLYSTILNYIYTQSKR